MAPDRHIPYGSCSFVTMLSSIALLALAGAASATVITSDRSVATNQSFDYVIVGAGLTGITVGNKLSEKGYTVLIIEAGPDAKDVAAVYNAELRGELGNYCNYKYPASNEDGSSAGWEIDLGYCVGGSTSINGMVWYRPTEGEINLLEYLGNPGWNWNSLEPYMAEIERNIKPDTTQIAEGADVLPAVHGYNGVVNTSFPTPMRIPLGQKLYKEAVPIAFPGLTVTGDLSNRTNVVSASTSWTIWYDEESDINRRSSAAWALLYPESQQRDTLTVLTGYHVTNVVFNGTTATGVQFGNQTISGNTLYSVSANKEVLLAAGALGSAPLLERSGIGSEDVLQKAGINQLVDLPGVGTNLVDQPGTSTSALVSNAYVNNTQLIDNVNLFAPDISLVNIYELYGDNATNVGTALQQSIISRATALVEVGASNNILGAMAILEAAITLIVDEGMPIIEFIGESYPEVMTAVFWPLTPLSRGWVHINSSDPFASPQIVPRLLSDEFDLQTSIAIARKSREVFTSAPFDGVIADAYASPSIGANGTDAEWAAYLKETSYAASHWAGSTALLPRLLGGVVSPSLNVYGTENLRVVDAGILRYEITSHTMSTAYAIALKAADLILEDA